jgi:hypothetical protein
VPTRPPRLLELEVPSIPQASAHWASHMLQTGAGASALLAVLVVVTILDAQIGVVVAERQAHVTVIVGVLAAPVVLARLLQLVVLAPGFDLGFLTIVREVHRHFPIAITLEGHGTLAAA